jgi:hypothetical protein
MRKRLRGTALGLLTYIFLFPAIAPAEAPVAVRHTEGLIHGFLVLRTVNGDTLADGDVSQVARGDRVTSRLVFHFKDGSLYEETAVFSQRGSFRLLSDHLTQKGPVFPHPMDVSLNGSTGEIDIRYTGDDGKEKSINDRLKLPPDIANGLTLILLKNIPPDAQKTTVSMVATTPKPRMVKLVITPSGDDPLTVGNSTYKATHYVVKIDIGGVAGVVAPIVGKQPPDIHVWVLHDDAPVFVKMEGPLYEGGPIWRIELASPVWPSH